MFNVEMLKRPVHADGGLMHTHPGLLNFSTTTSPYGPPSYLMSELRRSLGKILHFPDDQSTMLREKVAAKFGLDSVNTIVGNGTTEMIRMMTELHVRPGDEVIVSSPTFSEYEFCSKIFGGKVIQIMRRHQDDFKFEADPILESLTSRTKLIFICNPNNPTGDLASKDELLSVVESADRRGIFVVFDEAYIDFVGERHSIIDMVSEFSHLLVLRSVTKLYGIPGIRLGFGIGGRELIAMLMRNKLSYNVNILAQIAGLYILSDDSYREQVKQKLLEGRKYLSKQFSRLGFKVFPSCTNFFLVNTSSPGIKADNLAQELFKKEIIVRNCSGFDGLGDSFIRISALKKRNNYYLVGMVRDILGQS